MMLMWQIIFLIYTFCSLFFIFGGLTFMGAKMNKIHSFFKRIISLPIISLLPLFTFVILYTAILFVFYDNVCMSIYLYNRPQWLSNLFIIFEAQPFVALLLFSFNKSKLDPKKEASNYCYQRKKYY